MRLVQTGAVGEIMEIEAEGFLGSWGQGPWWGHGAGDSWGHGG